MTPLGRSAAHTIPPYDGEPAGLRISSEWVLREIARGLAEGANPEEGFPRVASILARASGSADVRILRIDGLAARVVGAARGPASGATLLADCPLAECLPPFAPVWSQVALGSDYAHVRALAREGVGALLYVPCVSGGELVGAVEVRGATEVPWNSAILAQLRAAADILALAIRADRDRVERHRAETARLVDARGHDVERERLEEQLAHAARLAGVGEATASIVHDVAHPLTALLAYVDHLGGMGGLPPGALRLLDPMRHAVDHIVRLVTHLRDYARAGPAAAAPVDLYETALRARELCSGLGREDITIAGRTGVLVQGDAVGLEQVLVNLMSNALRSGGAPVDVKIVARTVDDRPQAIVCVCDRGPGVPVELRSLVFEPFFTTRPRGEGTGLGLAICARIARDHGGSIEVEDNPGGGARFRLRLPLLTAR